MDPEDVSVQMVEWLIGPTETWIGQCYGVAEQVRDTWFPDARVAYGHYLGTVAPGSPFYTRRTGLPFIQHGWIELPGDEGQPILDPTRWVFEWAQPYLYHGVNDCYDEGGNAWRMLNLAPPPAPRPGELRIVPLWNVRTGDFVRGELFGLPESPPDGYTVAQLMWLANLDPALFGEDVGPIYRAVVLAGYGAFIPIDNRRKYQDRIGDVRQVLDLLAERREARHAG